MVGVALWPVSGVPLVVCLLLGSVIATTDPAAVIAVFRDVGAPARLTRLVEGESLLNDAAAIVMFVVFLGIIVSGRSPISPAAPAIRRRFPRRSILGVAAGRALLQLIPGRETIGSPKRRSRLRFPIWSSSAPSSSSMFREWSPYSRPD